MYNFSYLFWSFVLTTKYPREIFSVFFFIPFHSLLSASTSMMERWRKQTRLLKVRPNRYLKFKFFVFFWICFNKLNNMVFSLHIWWKILRKVIISQYYDHHISKHENTLYICWMLKYTYYFIFNERFSINSKYILQYSTICKQIKVRFLFVDIVDHKNWIILHKFKRKFTYKITKQKIHSLNKQDDRMPPCILFAIFVFG